MVDDVVVSDSSIDAEVRKNFSSQSTARLNKRIERGEYFRAVISFPAIAWRAVMYCSSWPVQARSSRQAQHLHSAS